MAISLWLILAVAVGGRALFAWQEARHIPPSVLATVPFAQEAGNIAEAVAQGRGFSDLYRQPTGPTAWLAPAYPLLLAGIFRIFGIFTLGAFWAAATLNICFSAGACVPLYFAGKRIGGVGLGAGAAWLWAVFPNGVIMPFEWIWVTSLAALLATTILWATIALDRSRRKRDWAGYGLLWGLALLASPELGSLLPFLVAWLVWRARAGAEGIADLKLEISETAGGTPAPQGAADFLKRRRPAALSDRLAGPALAIAIIAACCAPWTVRNYIRFHRLVPLRSDFPFELWIGNNEVLNPAGRNPMAEITAYGQIREYRQLGETAFLARKWREATEFIWSHKRLELWLSGRRAAAFWTGSADPVAAYRQADSLLIRFLFVANGVATLGALAGIVVLAWRRSPYAFPAAAFPVVYPCAFYVTHASLRYRHPIDPALMLLGAAAIAGLFVRQGLLRAGKSPAAGEAKEPAGSRRYNKQL